MQRASNGRRIRDGIDKSPCVGWSYEKWDGQDIMSGKGEVEVVPGILVAKEKVSSDLGEVAGVGKGLGIVVLDGLDGILDKTKVRIVYVAPISRQTKSEIMRAVKGDMRLGGGAATKGENASRSCRVRLGHGEA